MLSATTECLGFFFCASCRLGAAFHRACTRVPTKEVVAIFALVLGWMFMNAAATAFWLKKVLYATTGLALTVFSPGPQARGLAA
jgi:hypothetical protein